MGQLASTDNWFTGISHFQDNLAHVGSKLQGKGEDAVQVDLIQVKDTLKRKNQTMRQRHEKMQQPEQN